jgi:hypothetical protein
MKKKTCWAARTAVALLCSLYLSGQSSDDFRIFQEKGIPVASNPGYPVPARDDPRDISFREEFSIGSVEGDAHSIFGPVIGFTVDDEGCVYVLDRRAKEVRKFDPRGKYLFSFGREGQGPGEFSSPEEIRFLPGGQIMIFEGESQRFTCFSKSGQLKRNGRFQKLMVPPYFGLANGHLIAAHVLRDSSKTVITTGLFNDRCELIAAISRVENPLDPPWPDRNDRDARAKRLAEVFSRAAFRRREVIALNEREDILFAVTERYEIKIFNPRAELQRTIRTELPFLPVEKEDRQQFLDIIVPREISTWQSLGKPVQEKIKGLIRFPEKKPAFLKITPLDDDFLMIVRDCPPLGNALIDIFNPSGRFIIEKKVSFGIKEGIARRGRFYTLREDEDGNQTIKCYRYQWGSGVPGGS